MITHIECIPRKTMEDFKDKFLQRDDVAVISIIDPNMPFIFERNTHKILQLKFSDIEPGPFLKHSFICEDMTFMSHGQAMDIVSRINLLANDDNQWKLMINCSAGICRSGAIGQFAQAFSTMPDAHFASVNMHIKPNQYVFNKLVEVWFNCFKHELKVIQEDTLFD